jgi:hypothetical protein
MKESRLNSLSWTNQRTLLHSWDKLSWSTTDSRPVACYGFTEVGRNILKTIYFNYTFPVRRHDHINLGHANGHDTYFDSFNNVSLGILPLLFLRPLPYGPDHNRLDQFCLFALDPLAGLVLVVFSISEQQRVRWLQTWTLFSLAEMNL